MYLKWYIRLVTALSTKAGKFVTSDYLAVKKSGTLDWRRGFYNCSI